MRYSLVVATFVLAFYGCNDPVCGEGEIKIANDCRKLSPRTPDGGDPATGTTDGAVNVDSSSRRDAELAPRDTGIALRDSSVDSSPAEGTPCQDVTVQGRA